MKIFLWLGAILATASASPLQAPEPRRHGVGNVAHQDRCTPAETDRLMFELDIDAFERARAARDPSCFGWTSDGCSWSPDMPAGFNFKPSCARHDFGCYNVEKQGRLTKDMKVRIDDQFKQDMYDECRKSKAGKKLCKTLADVYYRAVRFCGDGSCLKPR